MDHIIQEIDDDLKRERLQNLWRNFGSHIVTLSIVILIGTVGIVGWKEYRDARDQEATDSLVFARELIESKKEDKALALLEEKVPAMRGSVSYIGKLWLAQLYMNVGKQDKAEGLLAEVTAQKDEVELAAYANLLSSKNNERFSNKDMFRALLQEKQALAALQQGDRMQAARILKALEEDATTPNSLRTRANLMLITLEKEVNALMQEKAPAKAVETSKP